MGLLRHTPGTEELLRLISQYKCEASLAHLSKNMFLDMVLSAGDRSGFVTMETLSWKIKPETCIASVYVDKPSAEPSTPPLSEDGPT